MGRGTVDRVIGSAPGMGRSGGEKKAAKALLDALILKHQARRWASAS